VEQENIRISHICPGIWLGRLYQETVNFQTMRNPVWVLESKAQALDFSCLERENPWLGFLCAPGVHENGRHGASYTEKGA
jgi:hypothetical protein